MVNKALYFWKKGYLGGGYTVDPAHLHVNGKKLLDWSPMAKDHTAKPSWTTIVGHSKHGTCLPVTTIQSDSVGRPVVLDVLICITFTKTFFFTSATAIRVRLANQSAVLVTGGGSESTLRSGAVTLWHITWAAALAVALGTAEISGQSLNSDGLLVRFAASFWVAVVSGVGCHGHLQQRRCIKKM